MGPCLRYRVWYAERKDWIPGKPTPHEDVLARGHLEIGNWQDAHDELPGATLAWSGKNKQTVVGFYMQEWKNPHPEKVIESIDITSVGRVGQYFILGITAGQEKK